MPEATINPPVGHAHDVRTHSIEAFALVPAPAPSAKKPGIRLDFLNGLRGLMALYVVTRHAYLEVHKHPSAHATSRAVALGLLLIDSGKLAVDVFIVLSGFLLMLPIVRGGRTSIPSIREFCKRRAFRVLPPYYIALCAAIVCILVVPGLGERSDSHWDMSLHGWNTPRSIISHILLLHNLCGDYAFSISHAMWSMATETQLYILFPLLLLPVWRRFGNRALMSMVLVLGVSVHYLLPSINQARLWYMINFALGMVGATLVFSKDDRLRSFKLKTPWMLLAWIFIGLAIVAAVNRDVARRHIWLPDAIVGFAATSIIVQLARRQMEYPNLSKGALRTILESRFAKFLGRVSFSLFLVHPMVLAGLNHLVRTRLHPSPAMHLALMLSLGLPLSVLVGWLFFLAVEQWFLPSRWDKKAAAD
jgi:peptidoglycan/LPS O-acetylase OafA/YrhL